MDTSVFFALVLACAPQVHSDTAHALVSVESGFNPWAIGVVGGALVRQPRYRAEALATARALQAAGWNFSVGLGQINVGNFDRLGLTLDAAFDPCTNLTAMQSVLAECFDRAQAPAATANMTANTATPQHADQTALRKALSCYYSGNFATGFRHGYVRKVVAAAGTSSLVASRAIPPAQPKEKT
ncbi:lytic transglycosylase domain-containing protein [Ideonella sp.]|uniref:lytic transglycosylase domain-containing protein n=1 Tax=Ideonella sp. TaxID=1929293 RepID=UPI003BB5ED78